MNECLVLRDANVITMADGPSTQRCDVLIDNGRIARIGAIADSAHAATIECGGRYVVPGFHDMHAHLKDSETDLAMLLVNGVTTIREMMGRPLYLEWRKRIAERDLLGPTIFNCSPVFEGEGLSAMAGMATDAFLIIGDVERARQEVRRVKEAGYDFVKVYDLLTPTVYEAIVDEAAACGMPVVGHVPRAVGVENAVKAGQVSLEHLMELRPEHAALIAAKGTWVVPTLIAMRKFELVWNTDARELLERDQRTRWINKTVLDVWRFACGFRQSASEETRAIWQKLADETRFSVLAPLLVTLHAAGCRIALGTDTPVQFVYPGIAVHEEMQNYVEAGLAPFDALMAATRNAAECLGLLSEHGTVETGKVADLVILDGNPLRDITHTQRIAGVVKGGRLFDRPTLSAMYDEIERACDISKEVATA